VEAVDELEAEGKAQREEEEQEVEPVERPEDMCHRADVE
jgi:hypothetical protein